MTLNDDVMALILRYFTEFDSLRGALSKSGWKCRRKKFTRYLMSWRLSCWATVYKTVRLMLPDRCPVLSVLSAWRIKMKLGMQVGLSQSDFV